MLVFIIAQDWMLRAGVRAELRERGITAMGLESVNDAAKIIAAGKTPSAVVVEAGLPGTNYEGFEQLARRVPVIVVASRWDRVPLESAAAVLYRPVRVGDVVAHVIQVLQGHPA